MTGRDLLRAISETIIDLDKEIPVTIIHRNSDRCVIANQSIGHMRLSLERFTIEGSTLGQREPN